MARSLKKNFYVHPSLLKKIKYLKEIKKKRTIKTWSRRSMIIPDFISYTFAVHNGHKFIDVYVTEDMVGHKLGEFSLTRKIGKHGSSKSK